MVGWGSSDSSKIRPCEHLSPAAPVHRHASRGRVARPRRRCRRPRQLRDQVHEARWQFSDDVEVIAGDVGDPSACRPRARGGRPGRAPCCGRRRRAVDVRDRAVRTMNTHGDGDLPRAARARVRRGRRRLVVASSMSIYGEGEYDAASHGSVAPGPRPEEQLARTSSGSAVARLRPRAHAGSGTTERSR